MHLLNCILQGLLTGVILSFMLGTVFFSLIKNSLSSGYKTGIYIAAGVILCDVLFISLAILSTEFAKFLENNQNTISILGGLVLLAMGIGMILRAKPKPDAGKSFHSSSKSVIYYIGNGFLLNILNPLNFFSWLAISSVLKIKFNYELIKIRYLKLIYLRNVGKNSFGLNSVGLRVRSTNIRFIL